jgi:hypothetical protein
MIGFLIGRLTGNDSHATQVGPSRRARHGGLGPIVNHSCDPNCGVRLNDAQAFDFVARQDLHPFPWPSPTGTVLGSPLITFTTRQASLDAADRSVAHPEGCLTLRFDPGRFL